MTATLHAQDLPAMLHITLQAGFPRFALNDLFMELTGIRQTVFLDRYAKKDEKGVPLEKTPEEMWGRVAHAIAQVESKSERQKWEDKFYEAMQDFVFVPGGRILSGAGTGYKVTFYNCFVIPSPHDSRGGILKTLTQMIEIMSRGGGVGINLSSLRPRGARVSRVNGFSSGPCNWAELFSVATKDIIQQGGSRRGALMLMLWDWHPDVEEFITVKQDLARINGANLSVCVSDAFMEAVKNDSDWDLVFPDKTDPDYDTKWDGYLPNWIALGKKPIVHKTIKARKIWDLVAEAAWKSAEPGVVFMERYNKWFNNYYWEYVNCVNPCGEEGLPSWGVCNLCSINLAPLVNDKGEMDYQRLAEIARIGVRFQDDVIDADFYVFDEIRQRQQKGERRIGLGTMGLGDALIKMKLRYGSKESLPVIDKIYKTIRDASYEASVEIAKEKGPFPKIDIKKHLEGHFIKDLSEETRKKLKKYGVRNSVVLQQAPTGSTSLLSGVSSGIEPVYEFEFLRRDRLGQHILRHPLYDKWYEEFKTTNGREPTKEDRPEYFVSANDLTPEDHVYVQAAIQRHVDASISKTVNAPTTHTIEDVKKLYTLAYELGCKGIAYMREGSRQGVLERMENKPSDAKALEGKQDEEKARTKYMPEVKPRPMVVHGSTYQVETPVGQAYVTINTNGGRQPLELFMNVGKAGSDVTAMAEAMGRLISLIFRMSSPITPIERAHKIAAELIGIGGARSLGFGENRVRSLPDAIAKVIDRHFGFFTKHRLTDAAPTESVANGHGLPQPISTNGHTGSQTQTPAIQLELEDKEQPIDEKAFAKAVAQQRMVTVDLCPSCGEGSLVFEESCKKCYSCGYSEC